MAFATPAMVRAVIYEFVRVRPQAEIFPRVLAEFSTEPEGVESVSARWTRLRITQVADDQYLCEKTRGPSPMDYRSATVGNLDSAKAFFGGGWVVRELFAKLDPVKYPRWP